MDETLKKVEKAVKYHDFRTACYLSTYLSENASEYGILAGIMHYFAREYSLSIFILSKHSTTTSLFYKALAYREVKRHAEAIKCIELILDNKTTEDPAMDPFFDRFVISPSDKEHLLCILGELFALIGKSESSIKCMSFSAAIQPSIPSVEALYSENIALDSIPESGGLILAYYKDLLRYTCDNWAKHSKKGLRHEQGLLRATQKVPGTGSYLVSKVAAACVRYGHEREGQRLFRFLRKRDPFFIDGMDEYSTMLWKERDENGLGLLAKELIQSHPNHYITWIVIGNYYSVQRKVNEATQAFIKSISIKENPHAYALLGFEYNTKSRYTDAQNYFMSSLCMLENNDRAMFGLGISYAEMFKKEIAEAYFIKAMVINPYSLQMKTYLVRFYVKNREYEKALDKIREYLGIDSTSRYSEILAHIEDKAGEFCELKELMICELAEIFFRNNNRILALQTLNTVCCRTTAYFSKKALIEGEES